MPPRRRKPWNTNLQPASTRATPPLFFQHPPGHRPSQRRPDIRSHIQPFVTRLVEVYEKTDPCLGSESEKDKLEKARWAISQWWSLFGELLLWAQSQLAGYEYARSNPKFMEELSKTFGEEITTDFHVLEYIGLLFSWNCVNHNDAIMKHVEDAVKEYGVPEMDFVAARGLIQELLTGLSVNSSFWRFPLRHALYASNLGYLDALLRPAAGRRQGNPVELLRWKVITLQHVYFHIGTGLKKYRALQLVADGLGQSTETLRSWEKSLLSDDKLMRQLEWARLAGALESDDKHTISESDPINIEYAKDILRRVRRTPLSKIRDGLRNSRNAKKSGI